MSARGLLEELAGVALAVETEVAWLLDEQLLIMAVSPAWNRFARANGGGDSTLAGAVIGTGWLGHIEGEQPRSLFENVALAALDLRERAAISGLRVEADCNTPSLRRQTSTQFVPILDGDAAIGLYVRSSVTAETPIGESYRIRELEALSFQDGLIRMCSGCRRVKTAELTWELVTQLIAHTPANVSHGFCDPCAALIYGV